MPYGCARLYLEVSMSERKRDRFVYKVLTQEQWAQFQSEDIFRGSPVDLEDGYIHLSCLSQLTETLDKWYAQYSVVALLEIETAEIEADLKYEVSRGGEDFPHLFADLPFTAVGRVWLVSPDQGVYRLPHDLNPN
jgi:uncharacterized protein (DUF952 family)